jgi:hypothetical protein
MSAGLLLDGLLVLVVALYVPIGAWRGGLREAALGAALVLGAATAFAWAPNWGDWLADESGVSQSTGRCLAAFVAFGAIGLGLGFAGGVIARRGVPDPLGRATGGLFALLNVFFALATSLSFVILYLPSGRPSRTVEESRLADLLAGNGDWLLLTAVPVYALAAIVCRWTLRFDDDVVEQPAMDRGVVTGGARRARTVGLPRDPEGGKVEPAPRGAVPGGRGRPEVGGLARVTRELVPPALVPADLARPTTLGGEPNLARGERADRPGADQPFPAVSTVVDDWLRRAAETASPRSGSEATPDATPRPQAGAPGGGEVATSFTGAAYSTLLDPGTEKTRRRERRSNRSDEQAPNRQPLPGEAPSQPEPDGTGGSSPLAPIRRCQVCGTPAVSGLERCPFCGEAL